MDAVQRSRISNVCEASGRTVRDRIKSTNRLAALAPDRACLGTGFQNTWSIESTRNELLMFLPDPLHVVETWVQL